MDEISSLINEITNDLTNYATKKEIEDILNQ
jgi:hypothetical protein